MTELLTYAKLHSDEREKHAMPVFQIYAKERDSGRERLMAVSEAASDKDAVESHKEQHPHTAQKCEVRAVKVA